MRDLVVIFRRRRKIVYGAVAILGVLATLYCAVATRRYEAKGVIQVQPKSQDGLGLETLAGGAADDETEALAANMNIQTQANILQSDTLALKTIEDLHLDNTRDFVPRWSPVGWILGLFATPDTPDPRNASLEDSPKRRHHVLLVFRRFLSVKPESGSRLLDISYLSSDPKLAAAVVNDLTQSLMDFSFKTRFDATNQASNWLGSQLGDLRQETERLRRQVAQLENQSGVYNLGTVDPTGHEQSYSGVLEQLQQATTAMTQAEQNRILRGAIARAADNGNAEMLSNLAGNTTNGATVNNTLGLIQNLRGQEAVQQAALQQAEAKYGSSYPKLAELRANLGGIETAINQETERLKGRAKSDYDVAQRTEADTRAQYNRIKTQADTLNDKSIDLAALKQEADQDGKLYEDLLSKFKEAGVLEGLKGSTITVVDPGRIPSKPKTPNIPLYLGAAVSGGFIFGCVLALIVDMMDKTFHNVEDLERIVGDHILGVTPYFRSNAASYSDMDGSHFVASLSEPQCSFAQSIRALRNALVLKLGEEYSKVILITSSIPGEGKTVLSSNLAVLLAEAGKAVLLVDTSAGNRDISEPLNLNSHSGPSELLPGQLRQPEIRPPNIVLNSDAISAGSLSFANSELSTSGRTLEDWLATLRAKYDYIVLDSASLLPANESLALASLSDIALLVSRPGLTEKSQLTRAYQLLARNSKRAVDAVLNGLHPEEDGYSVYCGHQQSERR
ncbi:MAG: Wzz/FepE/Etk N-terminal domain-containing protein [Terracidiphilus sp.]